MGDYPIDVSLPRDAGVFAAGGGLRSTDVLFGLPTPRPVTSAALFLLGDIVCGLILSARSELHIAPHVESRFW